MEVKPYREQPEAGEPPCSDSLVVFARDKYTPIYHRKNLWIFLNRIEHGLKDF